MWFFDTKMYFKHLELLLKSWYQILDLADIQTL